MHRISTIRRGSPEVRVLLGDDTVTTFEEWEGRHSDRVKALNRAHARLWRVAVYLHPDDDATSSARRLVRSAASELFGLPSRYAREELDEPYLATVYELHADERGWSIGEREARLRLAASARASTEELPSLTMTLDLLDRASDEAASKPDPQGRLGTT